MKLQDSNGILSIAGLSLPYAIVRSARRKRTIGITLEATVGLTILAPENTENVTIERMISQRSGWIAQRFSEIQEAEQQHHRREYVNGESIYYLGRQYRLRLENTEGTHPVCKMKGRWITVYLPTKGSDSNKPLIASTLRQWYCVNAEKHLPKRGVFWANKIGVTFNQIRISDQQKRWGSCDIQKNIRINWRVMMAPMSLVDYVIAHEVCHLIHADHSEHFWRLLASIMPDYEKRKAALKNLGRSLDLEEG
jgi:predicted metal-dependent hydrolase